MRVIVEFLPNISKNSKDIIKTNGIPSMVSPNETSCQYNLEDLIELLKETELNYDIGETDMIELTTLLSDGVDYIEF